MANVVIVSGTDFLDIAFNDLSSSVKLIDGRYKRSNILSVVNSTLGYVSVRMDGIVKEWQISLTGVNKTMPLDSIDGATPTDIDDLYSKLKVLMK